MTLQNKITALNETIRKEAAHLGLIFVSGPGPESVQRELCTPKGTNAVNGQARGVYLFGVANA